MLMRPRIATSRGFGRAATMRASCAMAGETTTAARATVKLHPLPRSPQPLRPTATARRIVGDQGPGAQLARQLVTVPRAA